MQHALYGASLRLCRAETHLSEAENLLRQWEQGCVDKIVRQDDGQFRFDGCPEIPPLLPVVVSDAIHNVRAALDYLVYELALLGSNGQAQNGTQFIIEDFKVHPADPSRGFDARAKKHLKGLRGAHIEAIEALQPYNGVEWTKTLRDISNPDKHRQLTVLRSDETIQARIQWTPHGRFATSGLNLHSPHNVSRFNVDVDGTYSIAVVLPKRPPTALLPTLRRIQAEAGQVIAAFEPEFEPAPFL